MPVLEKLIALESEADDFGFRWENTDQIMAQIVSECAEIRDHLNSTTHDGQTKLQEEIGDLLHAVFSLCVFCKFDAQDTLQKSIDKFERRLKTVKQLAKAQGLMTLKGKSFDELMLFWDKAKEEVG